MLSVSFFNARFTPSWLMIILTIVFVLLFCRLGVWQIQRAHQKETMLAVEAALAQKKPIFWDAGHGLPKQYQRVEVQGRYLDKVFLLDNQHQQHEFGYDILSPLMLADGSVLMVDRGWVLGDKMRQSFPHVQIPKQIIKVSGSAYFPSTKQWLLGAAWEKKEKDIIVTEVLDTNILSQILQKKLYPFIIRLDAQETHGFIRQWAIVSMPPQRHLAYAVQWFAMACVILILFVALNLKRK